MESEQEANEPELEFSSLSNTATLALSRAQKAFGSLFFTAEDEPDRTDGHEKSKNGASGLQEIREFALRNDRAAIGAPNAEDEDESISRAARGSGVNSEIERLRIQVLGRKAAKRLAAASAASSSKDGRYGGKGEYNSRKGETAHGEKRKANDGEDEEEEEMGRASAFKSKRVKQQSAAPAAEYTLTDRSQAAPEEEARGEDENDDGDSESVHDRAGVSVHGDRGQASPPAGDTLRRTKPSSYLDELLQEKSKKKNRKKKKSKTSIS